MTWVTRGTRATDTPPAVLARCSEGPDAVRYDQRLRVRHGPRSGDGRFLRGQGLKPRQIGPAHATIGRVNGQSRKALCGAYVSIDEQLPWPPEGYEDQQLCEQCATLAAL